MVLEQTAEEQESAGEGWSSAASQPLSVVVKELCYSFTGVSNSNIKSRTRGSRHSGSDNDAENAHVNLYSGRMNSTLLIPAGVKAAQASLKSRNMGGAMARQSGFTVPPRLLMSYLLKELNTLCELKCRQPDGYNGKERASVTRMGKSYGEPRKRSSSAPQRQDGA